MTTSPLVLLHANDGKFNAAVFAFLTSANGLALIQRCRALRQEHVAAALARLEYRLYVMSAIHHVAYSSCRL
jgi:hypothetical protein